MTQLNIEFKAKVADLDQLEGLLIASKPFYVGEDHQTDTYFNIAEGRLKLREGNIEHALIYYKRADHAGLKKSDILLYNHSPDPALKQLLTAVHGIRTVVKKRRRIYFLDNVKFHFDTVASLGTFVEVEAIDPDGSFGVEKLSAQCHTFATLFNIQPEDHVAVSYSDMLPDKTL